MFDKVLYYWSMWIIKSMLQHESLEDTIVVVGFQEKT